MNLDFFPFPCSKFICLVDLIFVYKLVYLLRTEKREK
uniref:Uncharacterized protein n=1 Tax=Anguilla anguilla TaxID=7936 RepID=A0A0E9SKQ9_ANGAN